MATATQRRYPIDPSVSNPLDILRGTIRRYVVIEGLLSAAIFVAAWFALGLVFDFVLFKATTWDWVLDAPWWFRLVALVCTVVLLGGIVATRIVYRLNKELSYPALALVLERRFPKILGDRLITAVELADVERSATFGYSADLVQQTIDEARERVQTVPVASVFNWTRLRLMAGLAGGIALLIVVTGYISFAAATGSVSPYRFGWRFAHVSGTFLERDLFLMNTPWPRQAHLELVRFPGQELRVGKDAPSPTIRVKAYEWVIADSNELLGWRPMVWGDLTEELVGGSIPDLPVDALRTAANAPELPSDPKAWNLDQVRVIAVDDSELRAKLSTILGADTYLTLENALDRVYRALSEQADKASMGRRLRQLPIPEKVRLLYSGETKSGDVTLTPQQNNEFLGVVADLKESVEFVVVARDFSTPPRTITLVPPPLFTKLVRTEYQPAYLHHAPPQGEGYPDLRGLRQRMPERSVPLTGDRSNFSVPSGTEVVLTAIADTDLTAAYLQPRTGILPWAKPGSADRVRIPIAADRRTVNVELLGEYRMAAGRTIDHWYFDDEGQAWISPVVTTASVEFDLIVEQADGVQAKRQILIQAVEDQPPVVEVAVDAIRKVGPLYYVTPVARIPFNPESVIRDDHGLSKVSYDYTYWPEDSEVGRALRAQIAMRPFLYPVAPVGFPGAVGSTYHAAKFKDQDKGDNRQNGSAEVGRFFDLRRALKSETRQRFDSILTSPLDETAPELIKRVELKSSDIDYFDLKPLKLASSGSDVQGRFRMDLNVVATDTNYDTGPRTGTNPELIRLLIVSEADLLLEINREEETFGTRLDEALAKIAGAKKKFEFVRTKNGNGSRDDIETARVRTSDASQDVTKARDIVQSIVREYRRIYRECTVNRVTEVTTIRFGQFGNRIDRILGENPPGFTDDERAQIKAGVLIPRMTFPEAERRLEVLLVPLTSTPTPSWAQPVVVSDVETALNVLEQELIAIRKAMGETQSKEKLKKMLASVIENQKRIQKELRDWDLEVRSKGLKKEPEILALGPQLFTKGEAKKLKQGLNWRLFDKDDLTIKFAVYDAADKERKKPLPADVLNVMPEIKLNFEQISLSPFFEYAVKAGGKEGDYVIVLTPEVGVPVTVPVSVK